MFRKIWLCILLHINFKQLSTTLTRQISKIFFLSMSEILEVLFQFSYLLVNFFFIFRLSDTISFFLSSSSLRLYLPSEYLRTTAPSHWVKRLTEAHKQLAGMRTDDAKWCYLVIARQMPCCGATFFEVLQGKTLATLGITEYGVLVYEVHHFTSPSNKKITSFLSIFFTYHFLFDFISLKHHKLTKEFGL